VWVVPDVLELLATEGLEVLLGYPPAAPLPLVCPLLLPLLWAHKGPAEARTIATAKSTAHFLMMFSGGLNPSGL
jgi:hypothetical protein